MSAVRRQGVIADHGSLEAYRDYVQQGLDETAARLAAKRISAITDMDRAHVGDLRMTLADWKLDLAWIDAELTRDAA